MDRLKIIGVLGHAKAGKTTVGEMLCEPYEGATLAFADKLKSIVTELFDLPPLACYENGAKEKPTQYPALTCPSCKSVEVERLTMDRVPMARCKICGSIGESGPFTAYWTPRQILQYIGTEGFRKVSDQVWSSYGIRQAKQLLNNGCKFVLFTDVRFRSECEAIWGVGGEVWRIRRPIADGKVGLAQHASETEQDLIPDSSMQAVIQNDGSLDELRGKATAQLNRFLASRQGHEERQVRAAGQL